MANIPAELVAALGLAKGDYLEFQRYLDGSIRIRKWTPTPTGAIHIDTHNAQRAADAIRQRQDGPTGEVRSNRTD